MKKLTTLSLISRLASGALVAWSQGSARAREGDPPTVGDEGQDGPWANGM